MIRPLFLIILCCTLGLTACRARIGEACDTEDGCALGLYCDLEREVCEDRGKLLKKGAAETYVYPIPPKTPPAGSTPLPVPVGGSSEKSDEEKNR